MRPILKHNNRNFVKQMTILRMKKPYCGIYEVCINKMSEKLESESEQAETLKYLTSLHNVIIAQGHNNMNVL